MNQITTTFWELITKTLNITAEQAPLLFGELTNYLLFLAIAKLIFSLTFAALPYIAYKFIKSFMISMHQLDVLDREKTKSWWEARLNQQTHKNDKEACQGHIQTGENRIARSKVEHKSHLMLLHCVFVVTTLFFTYQSSQHIIDVGKVLVAPRIYMVTEGIEFIKQLKQTNQK